MSFVGVHDGFPDTSLPHYLWSPSPQLLDPPVETRQHLLPVDKLAWPNAERLFLRLLARVEQVPTANFYGVAGQAQDGIDVYARIHSPLSRDSSNIARPFVVLQSKRVTSLTARAIERAVDKFLEGEWASRSQKFYYATSHSLRPTRLDNAVRNAEDRLGRLGIEFVPWGVERISELLGAEHELIDDFFGRGWVRAVCGDDAAAALGNRLEKHDFDDLRRELGRLYRSVFVTQDTGVANYGFDQTSSGAGGFVILDGVEMQSPEDIAAAASYRDEPPPRDPAPGALDSAPARTRRRRSAKQLNSLANAATSTHDDGATRERLDVWSTAGRLNLLVGAPGSGKSSFLRFLASDILSDDPQSVDIARQLSRSLPIWLPFAFLCSHLDGAESHSVLSAVKAWLNRHDCSAIWPLVELALDDERLLLIVDGLDEWTDPTLAEAALGQLETFLAHRDKISAVGSARPYALNFLALSLNWRRAQLAALTTMQQRAIAQRVFSAATPTTSPDVGDSAPSRARIAVQVEDLLNEAQSVRHISDIARFPLFLVLLASVWTGEPLPPRRFDVYQRLVALLLIHHPQMRRRSSRIPPGDLAPEDAERIWSAVAFKLRQDNASGYVTRPELRTLVIDALTDEAVLSWTEPRARDAADGIITAAEQHFGLLVTHGSGTIGFLHRVLYEHLAGRYLATLDLENQVAVCGQRVADPAWRDVILSTLSAQIRPSDTRFVVEGILAQAKTDLPDRCAPRELLAEALACGVALAPRDVRAYVQNLADEVETTPWQAYRLRLIASLTAALGAPQAQEALTPIFRKWMRARNAVPGVALIELARKAHVSDETVWDHLIWGLRHTDETVQLDAGSAIAARFGADPDRLTTLTNLLGDLESPSAAAAVVRAAAIGWPQHVETAQLISWARTQQSMPLRVAGIQALLDTSTTAEEVHLTDGEKRWLVWIFCRERIGGPWDRLAYRLLPLAVDGNSEIADACIRTLADNDTGSWDRQAAWMLACHAFGDNQRFRDWVIRELGTQHPLVMYAVSEIPTSWGLDPEFRDAVTDYIRREGSTTVSDGRIYVLSGLAKSEATRDALLSCLDTWQPSLIVRALLRDYPDDALVQAAIRQRFRRNPAESVKYSFVAVESLGLAQGFEFLREVLAYEVADTRYAAIALAAAWCDCKIIANSDPAAGPYLPDQMDDARRILSSYDAKSLASLCLTATSGFHMQYCSDEILRAWPSDEAVAERARELLDLTDARPHAVIAAYGDNDDAESLALIELALSQLGYLQPTLREAIAAELGAHNHDPRVVDSLLSDVWAADHDLAVSRASVITLSRAFKKASSMQELASYGPALRARIESFHDIVESEMTSLGTDFEPRRQIAWIAMLITEKFELIQTTYERRKRNEPARVRLEDLYGEVDRDLVGLLAQHWEDLEQHCRGRLFDWFGSVFGGEDVEARNRSAWSCFAVVALAYPVVAERLRSAISVDDKLLSNEHVVQWLAEQDPDRDALLAMLATLRKHDRSFRSSSIDFVESISWPIETEDMRDLILSSAAQRWTRGDGVRETTIDMETRWRLRGAHLELFAELYPGDPLTQAIFEDLRTDLNQRSDATSWTWTEVISLTVSAAPAEALPATLLHIYGSLFAGDNDQFHPMFAAAAFRRLRNDPDALAAILSCAEHSADAPRTEGAVLTRNEGWVQYEADDLAYWRSYFFARLADGSQLFGDNDRKMFQRRLRYPGPFMVIHDPVLFEERFLRVALLDMFVPYVALTP